MKQIAVISRYVDLNGGFWALEGVDGKKYEPVHMPNQLKQEGKRSLIWMEVLSEAMSTRMYGEIIRLEGFTT